MVMHYRRVRIADGAQAVVLAFDICSSSDLIEELTKRGDIDRYRSLIGSIKKYLAKLQVNALFEPYKFTGDGWILLFPEETLSAGALVNFMQKLCDHYRREFEKLKKYLDVVPSVAGINFGIDKGPLFHMTIYGVKEYIGRPINIACRLQGANREGTSSPAYKALITRAAFNSHLASSRRQQVKEVKRSLRNINGGAAFSCVELRFPKKARRR